MPTNTLKEQHLEAIRDNITCDTGQWGECGGINYESREEAAEACTIISESYADGFAEWIADNNWHRMKPTGLWYQHICPDYLTTAQLRQLYNEFLNNQK